MAEPRTEMTLPLKVSSPIWMYLETLVEFKKITLFKIVFLRVRLIQVFNDSDNAQISSLIRVHPKQGQPVLNLGFWIQSKEQHLPAIPQEQVDSKYNCHPFTQTVTKSNKSKILIPRVVLEKYYLKTRSICWKCKNLQ